MQPLPAAAPELLEVVAASVAAGGLLIIKQLDREFSFWRLLAERLAPNNRLAVDELLLLMVDVSANELLGSVVLVSVFPEEPSFGFGFGLVGLFEARLVRWRHSRSEWFSFYEREREIRPERAISSSAAEFNEGRLYKPVRRRRIAADGRRLIDQLLAGRRACASTASAAASASTAPLD